MDGNRRWAKSNKYSLLEAYEQGLETLNDTVNNFIKLKRNMRPLNLFY